MEEQKTPGTRIRALREMKFQSIRNLAEQAGISPSTLGRIETGAMKSIGRSVETWTLWPQGVPRKACAG